MTTFAVPAAPTPPLKDNSAAPPFSSTDMASPEFMDESYKAFDSYGNEAAEQEESLDDSQTPSNTVWNLLSTIYIPLLLLRLRRSIYGFIGLMRSILFGQVLQFFVSILAPSPETWHAISHSPWFLQLFGNANAANAKDPHAWPPPALKLLAVLTVLAFIVHPDGMTMIILRKLRNAMHSLLESSSTCWNFLIADFGILSTIAALLTFCSLFGLMYVLHKTLTPKTPKQQLNKKNDRKRKKRKGNHHARGGGGRGGGARIKPKAKLQPCGAETTKPADPPATSTRDMDEKDAPNSMKKDTESIDTSLHKTDFLPKELTTIGSKELHQSRSRGESTSTVDTMAMDDQSVESASMQSISSAPSAASTVVSRSPRSLNRLEEGKKKSPQDVDASKKRTNTNKKGRKGSALKGNGVVPASPSRSDVYRPPPMRNATSPATLVHTPNSRSRTSRRGGGSPANQASGKPFRSLADRMASSPVPGSNDSLFSTPLSSPATATTTHASVATGRPNPLSVPSLQAPILTPPPPSSTSLFSQAPSPNCPTGPAVSTTAPIGPSRHQTTASGKMELATFLARVGINGTVREDLVEALDNVDALYRLSDAQFELYNVSPEQKIGLDKMLQARRRWQQQSTVAAASPVAIRPPPGLTAPSKPKTYQPTTITSPPRINQVSSITSVSSPPFSATTNRTDIDFGGSPILAGAQNPPLSHSSLSYNETGRFYEQGDEEIEAELQELGGQMVGSVLDF